MKRMIALTLMALLCLTAIAAHAEDGSGTLVVYFDYSENMGDLSGMTVDAITSASLNAKTENTQGNLQVMAQAIQEVTGAEVFPIHVEETHDPVYLVYRGRNSPVLPFLASAGINDDVNI